MGLQASVSTFKNNASYCETKSLTFMLFLVVLNGNKTA